MTGNCSRQLLASRWSEWRSDRWLEGFHAPESAAMELWTGACVV